MDDMQIIRLLGKGDKMEETVCVFPFIFQELNVITTILGEVTIEDLQESIGEGERVVAKEKEQIYSPWWGLDSGAPFRISRTWH